MSENISATNVANQDTVNELMQYIISTTQKPPEVGELIDGTVIGLERSRLFVDLSPLGTGIIYGKEYAVARDLIRKIKPGDSITAKVVELSNKDGYVELSLQEAKQALVWGEIDDIIKNKTVIGVEVQEANKGGLLMSYNGVQGFLPASQLKAEHYPRVADGDKDKILEELKKLVGQVLEVCIIGSTPKDNKLIFSEKNLEINERKQDVSKYQVGDIYEGEITGIVEFGIFVRLEDNLEGLVHISEVDWGLVDNLKAMFKVGEKIKIKIIEIKDGKLSLSIKALKENPWIEAENKYKKGQQVRAMVIKFNKHGALASIEEGVSGLVHISEFGSQEALREKLEVGKVYDFKIAIFEPREQKMTLTYV